MAVEMPVRRPCSFDVSAGERGASHVVSSPVVASAAQIGAETSVPSRAASSAAAETHVDARSARTRTTRA